MGGLAERETQTVEVTGAFRDDAAARRAELSDRAVGDLEAGLRQYTGEEEAAFLAEHVPASTDLLARYCAISAFTRGLQVADRVRTVAAISQFDDEIGGSPTTFLPVRGDHLSVLLDACRAAVGYTWRHDCPPSEAQRETLDAVFDEPPSDIGLFAVCGPNWTDIPRDEYDVTGGPTTLFGLDGRIDSRRVGAQIPEPVESEVDVLRAGQSS